MSQTPSGSVRVLWASAAALALVLASAAVAGPAPVVAATPDVGAHVHVEVGNHPVDGKPIPQTRYSFQVTVKLHDQPSKATYFRIDDGNVGGATIKVKHAFPANGTGTGYSAGSLGPCADCSWTWTESVDFSKWSIGRHEIHWHVDIPTNADGQRQFTTARSQVCIVSCSPNKSGRSTPLNGGGSWYTGHDYAVAVLTSPESNVVPGGSVTIQSMYANAPQICAFLNPDFHANNRGTQLGCWTGGSHQVTIPADAANIGKKFVIYASDGFEAGLFRMAVRAPGADPLTATYEYQSWWSKTGLVLP